MAVSALREREHQGKRQALEEVEAHDRLVHEGLFVFAFFGSFFAPLAFEHWCHRRRAARIAQWAFVPVGDRRVSSPLEYAEREATGYRTATRILSTPPLPAGEWSLTQDEDGVIDVVIAPDGTHAVVRVDVPWTRRNFWPAKPTRVIATLRLFCVRDAHGLVLRAAALPTGIAFWWAFPFVSASVAQHSFSLVQSLGVLVGGLIVIAVAQIGPQSIWWLFNGSALRRAAASALEVVGTRLEASLAPSSADSTT